MSRSQSDGSYSSFEGQASALRRFVARGRRGARPGATIEENLEAQMQEAWVGLFDAMRAAGFERHDLVEATVSVTHGGQQGLYRRVRDRMLKGHRVAAAYLHVGALASPAALVEIEGWVHKR
jgi:enamine deaminase RidA (YjgF/YER057c/UK114 family)